MFYNCKIVFWKILASKNVTLVDFVSTHNGKILLGDEISLIHAVSGCYNWWNSISHSVRILVLKKHIKCYFRGDVPNRGKMNCSIFDKWHEKSGVFSIYDRTVDVARYVWQGYLLSTSWSKKVRYCCYRWSWCRRTEKKQACWLGLSRIASIAQLWDGHVRCLTVRV